MRREGWESLLADYLADDRPFQWGSRDCALWSAGWVQTCTGQDFTGPWAGRYTTAKGAAARMARLGFPDVASIADAHLPPTPVLLAKRGDLVLHPSGALGICNGLRSHFLTEAGLLTEPTLACGRAWAVG